MSLCICGGRDRPRSGILDLRCSESLLDCISLDTIPCVYGSVSFSLGKKHVLMRLGLMVVMEVDIQCIQRQSCSENGINNIDMEGLRHLGFPINTRATTTQLSCRISSVISDHLSTSARS